MDQKEIDALWAEHRDLRHDFYMHEAIGDERWKTVFNKLKELEEDHKEEHKEIKKRVDALYRLVLTVSGSTILILAGVILTEILV